jgi:glycosyltransferase involved in cell wall biosynthesis
MGDGRTRFGEKPEVTKKIMFVESAAEMGGVEFSTLYLAAHLDRRKWSPTVICPAEGKLASACRAENIEAVILPAPNLIPTSFRISLADVRFPNPLAWMWNAVSVARAAWTLRGFFLQSKPEMVVTKGLYAHFFGGLAARLSNTRCIWHVQDFISERFFGLYRAVFGLSALILPDEIVADGTPIAKQLPQKIQNRTCVILNGVDTNIFCPNKNAGTAIRTELGLSAEYLVIGHAARITPWKGQHHLLESFGQIAKRYPQARLLLVGSAIFDHDDYEKHLRARTKELGLEGQVTFAGFRNDLPQILNAMDIFAYPSVEKDTSPLALLSALACGLPIVAFDIAGIREVLQADGIIVPVRDEQAMSNALEQLLVNPVLRKQMQSQSRARAVAHFSLEKYIQNMESVFLRED